jgi:hypothetical protein
MKMSQKLKKKIQELPDLLGYVFGNAKRMPGMNPSEIPLEKKTVEEEEKKEGADGDTEDDKKEPPITLRT